LMYKLRPLNRAAAHQLFYQKVCIWNNMSDSPLTF
jgi:hypothetical protein